MRVSGRENRLQSQDHPQHVTTAQPLTSWSYHATSPMHGKSTSTQIRTRWSTRSSTLFSHTHSLIPKEGKAQTKPLAHEHSHGTHACKHTFTHTLTWLLPLSRTRHHCRKNALTAPFQRKHKPHPMRWQAPCRRVRHRTDQSRRGSRRDCSRRTGHLRSRTTSAAKASTLSALRRQSRTKRGHMSGESQRRAPVHQEQPNASTRTKLSEIHKWTKRETARTTVHNVHQDCSTMSKPEILRVQDGSAHSRLEATSGAHMVQMVQKQCTCSGLVPREREMLTQDTRTTFTARVCSFGRYKKSAPRGTPTQETRSSPPETSLRVE